MGYFRQFESFNPLSGALSDTFTYLPAIAQRARFLLRGRTVEEVGFAAAGIDWVIDEFFSDAIKSRQEEILSLKTQEIERISRVMNEPRRWKHEDTSDYEQAEKYCCFRSNSDGSGEWIFDSSKEALLERSIEESLGIPNSDDTDELTALKFCLEVWDDAEVAGPDFLDGKSYELFSVLALWKLSEVMERLRDDRVEYFDPQREFLIATDKFLEAVTGSRDFKIRFKFAHAAESAIQAMEAVAYAEHLFTMKRVEEKQAHSVTKKKEQERSQRSMSAIKLNIARHQKTNATKARVLEVWEKQPDQFLSAEKAGRHYSDWLQEKGLTFEPRTVTGWIRAHAKQLGIRFR
jgi:hypothetical protein